MLANLTQEQRELASYMSELSERAWCAAWMQDLEYSLWTAMTKGPNRYGRLDLDNEHITKLKALSHACNGWIRFDSLSEETFVPISQWIEQYWEPSLRGTR